MEVRPGYKLTEIGVIPAEWDTRRLRELSTIATGNTPPTHDKFNYGNEFLFVGPGDIGDTKYITRTEKGLSKKGFGISRRFPKDSILFVSIGSTIGKCGIAAFELASNQQINVILPSLKFTVDYLFYALYNDAPRIRAKAGEQAVPIVNKTQFSETVVALPPPPEQRVIAKALSDVDSIIESLDQLIEKKRNLKQAVMQQLLTGKTRLQGFDGEWEDKTLGELFKFSGGYSASRDQLSDEGYCYLHYGDIHGSTKTFIDTSHDYQNIPKLNNPLDQISPKSLLKDGDVVFVDASEDLEGTSRHIVVMNENNVPFISGLHTIVAKRKTDEFLPQYLRYCFQTAAIKKQFLFYSVGTKVTGISKTNIPKLTLPVPDKPEQFAISSVLSDMDEELAALEQQREKTRNLKQAMMQELLTGKTRLIKPGEFDGRTTTS